MDKIQISTPKISLINNIGIPPISPRNYTLAIVESGSNIPLSNKATPRMSPVIIQNNMIERLPHGSTIESSHVATLQLPGITRKSRQVHIYPKMITAPIISLGVLCEDGCTITL